MSAVIAAMLAALSVWVGLPPPAAHRCDAELAEGVRSSRWSRWASRHLTTRAEVNRREAIAASVPAVCDLLAVCVEAGTPPRAALPVIAAAMAEPTRGVLDGIAHQLSLGVDEPRAWRSLGEQPGYADVGRDLARSSGTGIALGDLLRAHAREARERTVVATRARARTVGVRAVIPLMVCFLPAFLLVGVVPIFGGIVGRLLGGLLG